MSRLPPSAVVLTWLALGCQSEQRHLALQEQTTTQPAETSSAAASGWSPSELRVPMDRLTRIQISRPQGPAAEQSITLEKRSDEWVITTPVAYPANEAAVEGMVAVFAEIEILSVTGGGASEPRSAGLDRANAIEVRAWSGGDLLRHLFLGRSTRETTFVQRAGDPRVLTVRGRCRRFFAKSLDEFRHPVITDVDVLRIERVVYSNAFGRMELGPLAASPGRFGIEGQALRNFNVDRASKDVAVLAQLRAKRFVSPTTDPRATGLGDPASSRATMLVRTEDGPRSVDVWIGARTSDGLLHLRTSESDQIYLVPGYLESSLVPRRSHFELSDEMLRRMETRRDPVEEEHPRGGEHDHVHHKARPKHVTPEILVALRALAEEQRRQATLSQD